LRRRLRVSSNAAAQIREAVRWWRANRSARDLLGSEIERGFDLIRTDPDISPLARSHPEIAGLRRLHLPRVRYFVYFRPIGADLIEIVAFWHTSRGTPPEL
jgi:plasmid stabilization system protein ParE